MRRIIVAAALFVALVATARADFQEGFAAYERGDYATALQEWRPLAGQGDASAQLNLGLMYDVGRGIPRNYAEAASWYRMSAEQGNAEAQFNLGLKHDLGQGVPQDYSEAVKWYRKAAEQGNVSALNNLGYMFDEGRGVPQDYVRAHLWYNLAAQWDELARKNRDIVAEKMTPDQIAEAQRLAREWKPKKP